jgi:predicted DNA-binding transcriptional regulator AlpA
MKKRLALATTGIDPVIEVDLNSEVWAIVHVAHFLGLEEKSAFSIVNDPDFPNPIANKQRNRRWLASDVRSHFIEKSKKPKQKKRNLNPEITLDSFEPTSYQLRIKGKVA